MTRNRITSTQLNDFTKAELNAHLHLHGHPNIVQLKTAFICASGS